MAKNLIIVDSCVLIKAFRNDPIAVKDLKSIEGRTAYSIITHLELLVGAKTISKKEIVSKIFESFYGIPLSKTISEKAIEIMQKYTTGRHSLSVPDCLIAATSDVTRFPILTYNRKDFDFIDSIILFK